MQLAPDAVVNAMSVPRSVGVPSRVAVWKPAGSAGVPVATVSIGGARNAGLLAARILAAGGDEHAAQLRERMVEFQEELRGLAMAKGEALRASR